MTNCQNSQPNKRTVHAIPLSHQTGEQAATRFQIVTWQTTLDIPTSPEQQKTLLINEQTVILIQTESLKPDLPKDKPESWNWTFLRVANPADLEDRTAQPDRSAAAARPQQNNRNRQPHFTKDQSIARQVAAKIAGKMVVNHPEQVRPGQTMTNAIIEAAQEIFDWIDQPVPANSPEEEPDPGPRLSQIQPPKMSANNPT